MAISSVVPLAARYDPEGVELGFLNATSGGKGVRTEEEVRRMFDRVGAPQGATPMGMMLESLLLDYLGRLENGEEGLRPLNVVRCF